MTLSLDRRHILASIAGLPLAAAAVVAGPNLAFARNSAEELVDEAADVMSEFLRDPDFEFMRNMVRTAQGVVILPALTKGGFILGAEGGSAVVLSRKRDGSWGYPAFYTLLSASLGLQIGGQVSKVVLVVRKEDALRALVKDTVKLGADASVAVGPVGAGVKGGTSTDLDAGIIAFSKNQGLFGGGAIEGGTMTSNLDRNELFYGRKLTGAQILIEHAGQNARADRLRQILPK